jgi:hypothetical protein
MLAIHRAELDVSFGVVHVECDPKERFAEPFLARKGWTTEVGGGRKHAMRALAGQWAGLLQVCPDVAALFGRGSPPGQAENRLSSGSTPGCPWPARRRTRR